MDKYNRYFRILLYSLFFFLISVSVVLAELTLESVYPNVGSIDAPLDVTLTGTGFDGNTRVSMTLDVGNKRSILGSIGVPGDAMDVVVVGDIAYVADYDLQIYRIATTNPPSIEHIETFPTPGDAVAITVVGNIAYVADGYNGLMMINVANPENPDLLNEGYVPPGISENTEACDVAVANQIAYVAYGENGLQVIDVSNPAIPVFMDKVDASNALGVTVVDGKAYVADNGYEKGLLIVDANPASLAELGNVTLHASCDVAVVDNIAYVADGEDGLQIIDVTLPLYSDPIKASIDTPGAAQDVKVVERVEYVDDEEVIKQIAYVADGPGGLQIIDVTDSTEPMMIGLVSDPGWAWGLWVDGDRAYVAHGISLVIVDVSNPALPEVIGKRETSHEGLVGNANGIALVANSAFLAVGSIGLQKINFSEPNEPGLPVTWQTGGTACDVKVVGSIAYLADWDTLRLIDLNTSSLIELSETLIPDNNPDLDPGDNFGVVGVTVVDQKAYVACGEYGLKVVDVNPSSPNYLKIIGSWTVNSSNVTAAYDVAIADNNAYIAYGQSGLQVIEIQPDDENTGYLTLTGIGSFDMEGDDARSVTRINDNRLYVTSANFLYVFDISIPEEPTAVDDPFVLQDFAENLTDKGDKAYVAIGASGIQMLDISDPDEPKRFGLVETLGYASDVEVSDNFDNIAFVADEGAGLVIVSLPHAPQNLVVNGNRISATLPPPESASHYSLQVLNDAESDEIPGAVTFLEPEDYQHQSLGKKAIIVAGHQGTSNYLWDDTRQAANMAYLALLSQGYNRDNILYLSPKKTDVDKDGSYEVKEDDENEPSSQSLEDAITDWALYSEELLLFMVDHGGLERFQLNYGEILDAENLKQWLDFLQEEGTNKVIVIYDACQSGSFIPALSPTPFGKERIVVTSSQADEYASFLNQGALSFSYQFWAHVLLDGYLAQAYNVAFKMMVDDQKARFDADGNGIPNEITDVISDVIIGRGRLAASTPPHIGRISPEQTLNCEQSTTILAKDIISLNPVRSVWAVIIPPLYRSPDIPVTDSDFEPKPLSGPTDGTWEREVTCDDFPKNGTYEVLIYAQDDDDRISLPRQTTIIQTAGTGCGADLSGDNDTDGLDLLYYSFDNKYLPLEQFASDFGKTDCSIN